MDRRSRTCRCFQLRSVKGTSIEVSLQDLPVEHLSLQVVAKAGWLCGAGAHLHAMPIPRRQRNVSTLASIEPVTRARRMNFNCQNEDGLEP